MTLITHGRNLVGAVLGKGHRALDLAVTQAVPRHEEQGEHPAQHALRGVRSGSDPARVLLAAQTNVAVDNVLEGLVKCGDAEREGVLRVGSLKRISAAVLPDFSQDHVYLHFHGRGAADREDASPNPDH